MRVLVSIIVIAAAAACQEPDPNYGPPNGIHGKSLPGDTTGGSTTPGADTPPGATTQTLFPSPYNATNPPAPTKSLKAAHLAAPAAAGAPPPEAYKDCLTAGCHDGKSTAGAPQWVFGGRVTTNKIGIAAAEVLVTSGGQTFGPIKTDPEGFFWIAGSAAIGADGKAAVRGATGAEKAMTGATTQASCMAGAACHVPGAQEISP